MQVVLEKIAYHFSFNEMSKGIQFPVKKENLITLQWMFAKTQIQMRTGTLWSLRFAYHLQRQEVLLLGTLDRRATQASRW